MRIQVYRQITLVFSTALLSEAFPGSSCSRSKGGKFFTLVLGNNDEEMLQTNDMLASYVGSANACYGGVEF